RRIDKYLCGADVVMRQSVCARERLQSSRVVHARPPGSDACLRGDVNRGEVQMHRAAHEFAHPLLHVVGSAPEGSDGRGYQPQRRSCSYGCWMIHATTITRVPVIVGPTGIGKSRLAFELALQTGGEIVVADSRQVYERLDIATNKPSAEHRRLVRYHMIDFVDPATTFNAAEYVEGARAAIEDIASRGRLPIVEGGTMLYVDALCDGFSLTGVAPNKELRDELSRLDVAR